MKRFSILCACLLVGICATLALAAGKLPFDRSRNPVQNAPAISPDVTNSRCQQVTGTKGTFVRYTTAGYLFHELDAVDNTGAAVKGKLYLDGKQVAVGTAPFKMVNGSGNAHAKATFSPYSATSRTLDFCIRRQ